jgi:hypothetical protein
MRKLKWTNKSKIDDFEDALFSSLSLLSSSLGELGVLAVQFFFY